MTVSDLVSHAVQGPSESLTHILFDHNPLHAQPQSRHRLCHLWLYARQHTASTEERCRPSSLQHIVRHLGVHGGNTGNVQDNQLRLGGDNVLEQDLHHALGPAVIHDSDQRQSEHILPYLNYRGGQRLLG